jgi:hypothetical protein
MNATSFFFLIFREQCIAEVRWAPLIYLLSSIFNGYIHVSGLLIDCWGGVVCMIKRAVFLKKKDGDIFPNFIDIK